MTAFPHSQFLCQMFACITALGTSRWRPSCNYALEQFVLCILDVGFSVVFDLELAFLVSFVVQICYVFLRFLSMIPRTSKAGDGVFGRVTIEAALPRAVH